jgi:transmembrane sensor
MNATQKREFQEPYPPAFRKKASAGEKETFARWFNQLDLSENVMSDGEEDAIQERVRQALQNHVFNTHSKNTITYFPFRLSSVAATVLVLMGVTFYFFMKPPTPEPPIAYQVIHTAKGERKLITLGDGTSIQLNNESSLKYPESFSAKTRDVYLSGEAFFQVKHNPAKPFRVHIEKLNVQVLGTSFDVKGYRGDKSISVTVATGKVGVSKVEGKAAFMLLPGDRLSYNKRDDKITKKKINPQDDIAWQQGELMFRDESLDAVCRSLERWYGIDMRIQSKSLRAKKVSLKIKGDDLASVMKMLSIAGGFQYQVKGKTVFLIP